MNTSKKNHIKNQQLIIIKMYKKVLFIAVAAIFMASCKQESTDLSAKKKELETLLKQQADINDKVTKLRKDIETMDTAAKAEKKIKTVEVTRVATQSFSHYVEGMAVVECDQNTLVFPKTPGFVINAVNVKPGDVVSAGQIMCTVDNTTLVQQLEALKTQYTLANTAYERQRNLWEKQIGSELQYLNAKTQKEAAEKNIAALQAQLANTNVVAPFTGTVDAVNYKVGDNSASATGGVRVINISRLKLTSKLADSYINKVKTGNKVIIVFPDLGNKEVEARVTFTGSSINSLTRTFDIQVLLDNPLGEYKPNMQARIKVNDITLPKVIVVNENIVMNSEGEKSILVLVHEGEYTVAKKVKVVTGESYGGLVVIKEGLKEGDEIITNGYANINDGEKIKL